MSDANLESEVAAYLSQPVTGERLTGSMALTPRLWALLPALAAERGVSVEALVEFMLFKQIRSDQARRMVGEKQELVPSSFANALIATAKVQEQRDLEVRKSLIEGGGDKATRLVAQMQAVLDDTRGGVDPEIEALNRRVAEADAKVDLGLAKKR